MKHNWLSLPAIQELHGYSYEILFRQYRDNIALPATAFKTVDGVIMVDEKVILYRQAKRFYYWNYAHELYFNLRSIFQSDFALASWLHKLDNRISVMTWCGHFGDDMFRPLNKDMSTTMTSLRYRFVRLGRWMLAIRKRYIKQKGYLR